MYVIIGVLIMAPSQITTMQIKLNYGTISNYDHAN